MNRHTDISVTGNLFCNAYFFSSFKLPFLKVFTEVNPLIGQAWKQYLQWIYWEAEASLKSGLYFILLDIHLFRSNHFEQKTNISFWPPKSKIEEKKTYYAVTCCILFYLNNFHKQLHFLSKQVKLSKLIKLVQLVYKSCNNKMKKFHLCIIVLLYVSFIYTPIIYLFNSDMKNTPKCH